MTVRAARSWTCGLLAIALFVGGCAGQSGARQNARQQASVLEVNRARIVELQVRQQAQPGFDAGPELLAAYTNAQAAGDREGAAFAAALLVNSGHGELYLQGLSADLSQDFGQDLQQDLGQAVVAGLEVCEDSGMQASMRAALTTLCARGLRFEEACQSTIAFTAIDPEIIGVWIQQGYRHLLMEDLAKAEAVVEELRAMLTEDFVAEHGLWAADILFLDAVLLGALSVDDDATAHLDRAGQAFELLKSSLDVDAFSEQVFQFSEQFRMRGIDWLAVLMLQKYVEQAGSERERAVRTVQFAQVLHEAGRWAELLELGVADVDSVEAHMLALYRSDAANQLGARDLSLELRDQAIKSDALLTSRQMFDLLKLAIQMDIRRGDLKRAQAVGEAVEFVDSSDADVQSMQSVEGRGALAGLLGARAEVLALLGEHEQAQQLFEESLAMFGELPVHASASVRVDVLEAWGRTAQRVGQLQEAIEQLVLFGTQLSHFFEPAAARDASVALIRLRLLSGIGSEAHQQFVELLDAGLSSGASPVANGCLRAKIGLFGYGYEGDSSGLSDDLKHCVTLSARPDERAEAQWLSALVDPSTTLKERIAQTRAYQKTLASGESREAERLTYLIELGSAQESGRDSVGLGIAKIIGELRPIDARLELMELLKDDQVMAEHRVEVMRMLLQVSLVFGHWQQAGLFAGEIETLASEPGDAQIRADVRALVKRFFLEKWHEN